MKSRRHILQTLLAGGAGALLVACSPSGKPQFASIDLTGADYARDFQLPDQDGRQRSLKDFKGKLVVLFFGYTQCPDVCPATMGELSAAKKLLGADAEKLQVLFITVDPERDTASVLKAYMGNFDAGFLALRPTPEQLVSVAKEYKTYYKKVEGQTPGSYTMDHSAGSYIYDPSGRIRLYTRYNGGAQALADDVAQLLREG